MTGDATGLDAAVEYHVVNSLGWPDLRPLQRAAVTPVRSGADCLLLAPTAGGKTEAAVFPLLSQMQQASWRGLSVLYVTPLRALLNNLHPRLSTYAAWLGRGAGLWHGDTTAGQRRRLLTDPPDILLTTPESLEAMLVSTTVDHRFLFAGLRAVVVDELHAFAGDDRGWHLLAVMERLQRLARRRLQRIGLSATVGNPDQLLAWLGGGTAADRAVVVAPDSMQTSAGGVGGAHAAGDGGAHAAAAPAAATGGGGGDGGGARAVADITVDYVASVANAATVVSRLHAGEKRLVFCEARAQAEQMAAQLRDLGVTTFVSHSSLSAEERRRSEQAFAEARDCVVVATATLELGIDVGDLDRVIQLDAPRTVASFLQRLGRTGRRAGTTRNTLFLATTQDSLLQAAGLLRLWRQGYVEPVVPPPHPRHIEAQQLLALALQEGRIGLNTWPQWWAGLAMMADARQILDHLLAAGFLAVDEGFAFVGDSAERHFGRRNFMDLTAVFTVAPELAVVQGRTPIGTISPLALGPRDQPGPTLLSLAGRTWRVTHVDWRTRQVAVVADTGRGRSRWAAGAIGPGLSFELAQSIRQVLLGDDPDVELSRRAVAQLRLTREERADLVDPAATVLAGTPDATTWWTFAGDNANRSLAAALTAQDMEATSDTFAVRTPRVLTETHLRAAADILASDQPPAPALRAEVVDGLKFSVALPADLAGRTLTERITDPSTALRVARG